MPGGQSAVILDGAMGTELSARGVDTSGRDWSAGALVSAPDVVAAIHREYAAAGATLHTANTFRAKRRARPRDWEELAAHAVTLARNAVPVNHRVAGSIAPLEDCYRPDLSPKDARPEHRELARVLAGAGVDIILCETFPHAGEALVAVEEAVATGKETWVALTAGPRGDLMTPKAMAEAARACADRGARAVLVNCVAASRTLAYVDALAAIHGVACGAYANALADEYVTPDIYAGLARAWIDAGATIVGGCCGTTSAHVRALVTAPPDLLSRL
jgi:S-methylmethionine-dependent homocysteine/selenocysteine methylase